MKKHLHNSLRALFLSLAVLLSLPMLAEEVEIDGIRYDLDAETKQAAVTGLGRNFSESPELVIPESVEYKAAIYKVTSIGEQAFRYCSGFTSVTIPNSVTNIGWQAFYGCSGLTSLTIPNSVTNIGHRAFSGCSGLTSVTIPNSVESIEYYAFEDCSGLTSVIIGDGITSIDQGVFSGCSGLTSVHISDIIAWCNIEFAGSDSNPLFYAHHLYLNGEEVKDLVIPNSVTSIGYGAFYGCSGLTSVTIPHSVDSIGQDAFEGCTSLTSVHIFDIAAWCNTSFNTSSSNPLYYAHHLYVNGEEVRNLVIPNSVTSIGGSAFSGCSGLTSVTIPNSVTSIGSSAFYGCYSLTSVTIPNSVTSIRSSAFYGCYSLTSVTIPNGVESIGSHAFRYCSGFTSVTIPNSVTSIGSRAFSGCYSLTSVTIGNSVTWIGSDAFCECPELLDVYCYAENVPSTQSNAFSSSPIVDATLHVPNASVDSYKATAPWSSFGKIVALTPEETGIGELKGENGTENSAIYDLSGRRVQKAQKGIFIQNSKVVVK